MQFFKELKSTLQSSIVFWFRNLANRSLPLTGRSVVKLKNGCFLLAYTYFHFNAVMASAEVEISEAACNFGETKLCFSSKLPSVPFSSVFLIMQLHHLLHCSMLDMIHRSSGKIK